MEFGHGGKAVPEWPDCLPQQHTSNMATVVGDRQLLLILFEFFPTSSLPLQ